MTFCFRLRKYESSVGRYIVAGEEIKKNQLICQEKAFAFVPIYNDNKSNILYHCQNCAKTNCLPFPCNECSRASYCSPICLKAHESIHKYECGGYQKNLWKNIGIAHLAFRNFIIGFNDLIAFFENVNEMITLKDLLVKVNEMNGTYADVLKLVTNFSKMDSKDCLRYALTANMLTIYLDDFTYFFDNLPEVCKRIMPETDDWKLFAAALLMKHMGQLVCS